MAGDRVLVLGSGAREHALAWKIMQSEAIAKVYCAPGNAGTEAMLGEAPMVRPEEPESVLALCKELAIDWVVVGPEAPLVAGVTDALREHGIVVFGPNQDAARFEGSKAFSKAFMARHQIPTAGFALFDDPEAAKKYIAEAQRPLVVKADGLAAGKGVVVAKTTEEALDAIDTMMVKRVFGAAGDVVVIEECLVGPEISYHVVLDGTRALSLVACQDHKRLLDRDQGPNTGGMGAYSPPPFVDAALEKKIQTGVVAPTLKGFSAEGIDFRGVLFIGLMIVEGEPIVLEYNVRFGDPETEVMMLRYGGDIVPLLKGAALGDLRDVTPTWEHAAALCVVLAAGGYPDAPQKGMAIASGDDNTPAQVFHAGTQRTPEPAVVTNGGRVLVVGAAADSVQLAHELAYQRIRTIHFDGMQYRKDIGYQALRAAN